MGVIQLIVTWINGVYSLRINGKMAVVGNTTYMWKVLRLPMEFFSQRMAENGFFEKWAGYQASVNTQQVKFEKLNQYLGMVPSLVSSLANTAVWK